MAQKTMLMHVCELCKLGESHCKCHRSANRESWYPEDDFLRDHEFTIATRPKRGPARWKHKSTGDRLYTRDQAEAKIKRDQQQRQLDRD